MVRSRKDDTTLVYSTELGQVCPKCHKAVGDCVCRQARSSPRGDGIVRVARETKGRKGKGVTVISGIPLEPSALQDLAKLLKKKCSAGGTVRDGTIEIQGDHRETVIVQLTKQGFTVKRSGG